MANQLFRDYATRVAFHIQLSRNQIAAFRSAIFDIEHEDKGFNWRTENDPIEAERKAAKDQGLQYPNSIVVGYRGLLAMGLLEQDPRHLEQERFSAEARANGKYYTRTYWGPSLKLTRAGYLMKELLIEAGLMPRSIRDNDNHKPKQAKTPTRRQNRR
jgi:hypothetical protein